MFTLFKFEKDIDERLELVPMTVRRKFDLVGLKIHLKEWTALTSAERRVVCHLPVGSDEERDTLLGFLKEAIARRMGAEPAAISPSSDLPEDSIPEAVGARIARHGLDPGRWAGFDAEQRFALDKCAKDENRFMAAWNEFARR